MSMIAFDVEKKLLVVILIFQCFCPGHQVYISMLISIIYCYKVFPSSTITTVTKESTRARFWIFFFLATTAFFYRLENKLQRKSIGNFFFDSSSASAITDLH